MKFEQNGPSKKTSVASPVLSTSQQNVLSNYFPKVSIANSKAFRSVNGSPKKSLTVGDSTKKSVFSSSQRRVTSSRISLRNSLKAMESTSVTAPQDAGGPEGKLPSKRPRLEDKTFFDNFFIKKEQTQSGGNDLKSSLRPPAAAQDPSSSSSQSRVVHCPVCQDEVSEAQINEHLDWCLQRDSTQVKS